MIASVLSDSESDSRADSESESGESESARACTRQKNVGRAKNQRSSEEPSTMRPSIEVSVERASVSAANVLVQRSVYNVWVRFEGESRRIPYPLAAFVELRDEVRLAHLAPPLSSPFPERYTLASAAASALRSFGLGEPTPPSMAQGLNLWLSELCLRAELSTGKPLALPHALRCTLSNWLRIPQPRENDELAVRGPCE